MSSADPLPPYTYVPGGPWPHPRSSPQGHSYGHAPPKLAITAANQCVASGTFLRGVALFNAGYYWEAHDVWEGLWHAYGRHGLAADVVKALIKLAAAGVKCARATSTACESMPAAPQSSWPRCVPKAGTIKWGWTLPC